MGVVAVPGFGDTAAYWSVPVAQALCGLPPLEVAWPGLWGVPSSVSPVSDAVAAVVAFSDGSSVLVGHSFGSKVVLAAAAVSSPVAVVLIAPSLGVPSWLAADRLEVWRAAGVRSVRRPDPVSGLPVVFGLPWAFASDALSLGDVLPPSVPVLVVHMSADGPERCAQTKTLLPGAVVRTVEGPHRFWEDEASFSEVLAVCAEWASS